MKQLISYLILTILSMKIQSTLTENVSEKTIFINESVDLSSQNNNSKLNFYKDRKHAIYYQTGNDYKTSKRDLFQYLNPLEETTTSIYDVNYEDNNVTAKEENISTTTEYAETTTEIENVTEISIFGKNHSLKSKEHNKGSSSQCKCDLSYKSCDLNCCCDADCLDKEKIIFGCDKQTDKVDKELEDFFCHATDNDRMILFGVQDLICIAKTNIPKKIKQDVDYKLKIERNNNPAAQWRQYPTNKYDEIKLKKYVYNDPILMLNNGTVLKVDVPVSKLNGYCHGRKAIRFLKEESWVCNVMLKESEMFNILDYADDSNVVTANQSNSDVDSLNCSTIFCTKWKVMFCNQSSCASYNNTVHEPICKKNICTNIAYRIDYEFQYVDEKIENATIYLYTRSQDVETHLISQEINIKFLVGTNKGNKKMSGNTGYIMGYPLIVSKQSGNHSEHLFNNSAPFENIMVPENVNGKCVLTKTMHKVVNFGTNMRRKCRYDFENFKKINATEQCKNIDKMMKDFLSAGEGFISPLGNPYGIKDEDWLRINIEQKQVSGIFRNDKLICENVITRLSLHFYYANLAEGSDEKLLKIISAQLNSPQSNITIDMADPSTIVTVETLFTDITIKPEYKYATIPDLGISIPSDFFFPFSN